MNKKSHPVQRLLRSSVLWLGTLTLLGVACQHRTVYDQFQHTQLAGWDKAEQLHFAVPRQSEAGKFVLELQLRTNLTYPFQQLSLVVEQKVWPEKRTVVDTLHCTLADKKGKRTGNGVGLLQHSFHVREIKLQKGDSIQVTVSHNMQREILPGISDVGVKLVRIAP